MAEATRGFWGTDSTLLFFFLLLVLLFCYTPCFRAISPDSLLFFFLLLIVLFGGRSFWC
ncbi:hypothetical protein [Natronincola peptidivorans]|uniref:hypothetical protein n=1 Tax=Natronincola peptidivorans TaxID=426128 RepID=UPI00147C9C49|nr:hypothetical protein [Natronincola peptidivorans]